MKTRTFDVSNACVNRVREFESPRALIAANRSPRRALLLFNQPENEMRPSQEKSLKIILGESKGIFIYGAMFKSQSVCSSETIILDISIIISYRGNFQRRF